MNCFEYAQEPFSPSYNYVINGIIDDNAHNKNQSLIYLSLSESFSNVGKIGSSKNLLSTEEKQWGHSTIKNSNSPVLFAAPSLRRNLERLKMKAAGVLSVILNSAQMKNLSMNSKCTKKHFLMNSRVFPNPPCNSHIRFDSSYDPRLSTTDCSVLIIFVLALSRAI